MNALCSVRPSVMDKWNRRRTRGVIKSLVTGMIIQPISSQGREDQSDESEDINEYFFSVQSAMPLIMLLYFSFLLVLLQEVFHGFFKKVIDALIKINGELFDILENRHIQTCRKGLSFIHGILISSERFNVNK